MGCRKQVEVRVAISHILGTHPFTGKFNEIVLEKATAPVETLLCHILYGTNSLHKYLYYVVVSLFFLLFYSGKQSFLTSIFVQRVWLKPPTSSICNSSSS